MKTALITGASQGLGKALAFDLAHAGWALVIDARTEWQLADAALQLADLTHVRAITGDVADPEHRIELISAARALGGLDLLVNNASTLGPTPLRSLTSVTVQQLDDVLRVNVLAPLSLIQLALPLLQEREGAVVNLSSDAAVEHYEGWGAYGAAKAALDHATLTLAAENPKIAWYAIDPGDMRTTMHQDAFPGEDISDRPLPESVPPLLRTLLESHPPSGRYRASGFAATLAS